MCLFYFLSDFILKLCDIIFNQYIGTVSLFRIFIVYKRIIESPHMT
ncbi:hypothetical protein EVA_19150 [gut metagenome]|uniref:Uncharacterized protein n=1 Tax=gut metagenome TaxID=749906 RepID=J9FZH5_9ZZZZ